MEETKYLGATYIDTVTNGILQDGIIALHRDCIAGIYSKSDFDKAHPGQQSSVQWMNGIIIPGLVNAHCHLELSYLKSRITQHTGLSDFITQVEKLKSADKGHILHCAYEADDEMYQNGIVYVGDVCNTLDAQLVREESKIKYYHFCEVYGIDEQKAEFAYERIKALKACISAPDKSIVPHAPYSVSNKLFSLIEHGKEELVSIHNQESAAEDDMFKNKSGEIVERLVNWGINLDGFEPTGKTSLQSYYDSLPHNERKMFVHNTCTTPDLINAYSHPLNYWCLCPGANLFIENKLPALETFFLQKDNCVVGTDSLASNTELNIIHELKIIFDYLMQHKIQLPALEVFSRLVRFATLNGARFFNCENYLGSIETGKSPGIVLLENGDFNFNYSRIIRLV
ncbi:MAG: amidohydrolase family protein [Bacteroidetes bacterium]|nr:amidohydrolase family protein [Bacteroidota bacterium]